MIRKLSSQHGVGLLCQVLSVSRSGYYEWLNHKPSQRELEDTTIRREIIKSHTQAPSYGADNIHADVRERVVCGRNRVRRLMKEMGIASKRKRPYRVRTTNSRHGLPVAKNLIKGLTVTAPDQVWVSDITFIPTDEGWLYLAIVKDKYTREIVGYATCEHIDAQLCIQALTKAIERYNPSKGLIHHSDRGSQYCSAAYQSLLSKHGILPSMSRKGNPYDNAMAENFFSCYKCESMYLQHFNTRRDAMLAVFSYIDGFYNSRRRHTALGRISPRQMRLRWLRAQGFVGGTYTANAASVVKGTTDPLDNGCRVCDPKPPEKP